MMRKSVLALFVILLSSSAALGQDTLKVMNYNLLNYSNASRDQYYRTVLRHVKPDVLVVQEMISQSMVDNFLSNVLNVVFPGEFAKGMFVDGNDTDNAIFYKPSKFAFISNIPLRTALRDISEFTLYSVSAADTFRVYSVHLKASSGSSNEAQRTAEVAVLRNRTNTFSSGKYFLVTGDFNIYGSGEQAYQNLLQDNSGDDGHFLDALSLTGTWNNVAYAPYHTQSPRVRQFGGGATGGMDDRFDMILYSRAINQPGKVRYLVNSLQAIGNDGNHYNDSVNRLPNNAVPDSVANALHNASDHIPILSLFIFSPQITFTIVASAGPNGAISPSGSVFVPSGSNQTFTISPDYGFQIDSLIVDGSSTPVQPSYTFTNVMSSHSIRTVFRVRQYTLLASVSGNGTISPSGIVTVGHGATQTFAFAPAGGYRLDSLLVDGIRVDSTTSYTFANITANHSINVRFSADTAATVFAINAGWNLLSVPRTPIDSNVTVVFPGAVSGTINSFLTGTYTQPTTLNTGEGYWGFFATSESGSISGATLSSASVTITTGGRWVLIGSLTSSVPTTMLISNPPGAIVSGTLFAWDGTSYYSPSTLDPGHGYWVFVNAPCTISINQTGVMQIGENRSSPPL